MKIIYKSQVKNPKLGFYEVGKDIFYNKVEALEAATRLKIPFSAVHWNFNDDAFKTVNWSIEPDLPLKSFYELRARQLREKYDYIRLEVSGGGDSSTAAYSFINNGIHLDEVVFRYPKTGEKNVTDDPFNTKPENTLSEWRYAAMPLLKWIADHAPNTKITIHDYSEDMLASGHEEDWVFRTKDYFQPGHAFKHTVDAVDSHKRTLDQGLKVCMLWGVDKPKVCIDRKSTRLNSSHT